MPSSLIVRENHSELNVSATGIPIVDSGSAVSVLKGIMDGLGWRDLHDDMVSADQQAALELRCFQQAVADYEEQPNNTTREKLIAVLTKALAITEAEYDWARQKQRQAQREAQARSNRSRTGWGEWFMDGLQSFFDSSALQQAAKYGEIAQARQEQRYRLQTALAELTQAAAETMDEDQFIPVTAEATRPGHVALFAQPDVVPDVASEQILEITPAQADLPAEGSHDQPRRWLQTATPEFVVSYGGGIDPHDDYNPRVIVLSTGDFLVIWDDIFGSVRDVYARRYSAVGAALGDEFRVNTYTTDRQFGASMTALSTGDFVVVWDSYGQDGDSWGIYAQRYSAAGVTLGAEFRVNTYTADQQFGASMTALSTGDFVVVWTSNGQDGDSYGVYAQRYSAAGITLGAEFRVNTYTAFDQYSPKITALSTGGFVVVWNSYKQDGDRSGIYAQCYSAAGVTLGAEFRVNTYTADEQYLASMTALSTGGFVVVWDSYRQDGDGWGIYAQCYSAAGVTLGAEFRVSTYTAYQQNWASMTALSTGDFVVIWSSKEQDGNDNNYGVYAQRYSAAGVSLGAEFHVNTYHYFTINYSYLPSITALSTGDFVVVWNGAEQNGNGYGIYAQRYSAAGVTLGANFRVNTYVGYSYYPSVTALSTGDFVVVWNGAEQNGNGYGIYAQRYSAAGVTLGANFRVNTYAGYSYYPSVTALSTGDFVVVWSNAGQDSYRSDRIYAQRYSAAGVTLGANFRVNTCHNSPPSVTALSNTGFVVVWSGYCRDGYHNDIYARMFHFSSPLVTTVPLADQTAWVGRTFSFTLPNTTFSDPDGDALTFTAQADGSGWPDWLSFDSATHNFRGAPPKTAVGTSSIRVTASDPDGAQVSDTFSLVVTPSLAATSLHQVLNYTENTALNLDRITITQTAVGNVTVRLSLSDPAVGGLTAGVFGSVTAVYNHSSGSWQAAGVMADVQTAVNHVQFIPIPNGSGSATIGVHIADGVNDDLTGTITLTGIAFNEAPVMNRPVSDQFAHVGLAFHLPFADVFSDPDDEPLTLTATVQNSSAPVHWLVFDPVTSVFSGAPSKDVAGVMTVQVTARDHAGLSTAAYFTLTVSPSLSLTVLNHRLTYTEDQLLSLGGIGVTALARPEVQAVLTLSRPQAGRLTVSTAARSVSASYDVSTGIWTASGATAEVVTVVNNVRFLPALNVNEELSLAIQVSDGVNNPVADTLVLTGIAVNDAPKIKGETGYLDYASYGQAVAVESALEVTDVDDELLAGGTVQLTTHFDPLTDKLSYTDQPLISAVYDSSHGILTLNGSAPVDYYQTLLRSLTYEQAIEPAQTQTKTMVLQVSDGQLSSETFVRKIRLISAGYSPCPIPALADRAKKDPVCMTVIAATSLASLAGLASLILSAVLLIIIPYKNKTSWLKPYLYVHFRLWQLLRLDMPAESHPESQAYKETVFALLEEILAVERGETDEQDPYRNVRERIGLITTTDKAQAEQIARTLVGAMQQVILFRRLYGDDREPERVGKLSIEMPIYRKHYCANPLPCLTTYQYRDEVVRAVFADIVQRYRYHLVPPAFNRERKEIKRVKQDDFKHLAIEGEEDDDEQPGRTIRIHPRVPQAAWIEMEQEEKKPTVGSSILDYRAG